MGLENSLFRKIITSIRKYFFTGILSFIPAFIGCYILYIIIKFFADFNKILPPTLVDVLMINLGISARFISFIMVLLFFALLTGLGFVSSKYFGKKMISWFSYLFERVPIVGGIYRAISKILDTMFSGSDNFKGVGLVRYPHEKYYTIAFIVGAAAPVIQKKFTKPMMNCFVPTTPNPTSGFYIVVPEDEIISLDIGIDQGLGLLLSLGVSSSKE